MLPLSSLRELAECGILLLGADTCTSANSPTMLDLFHGLVPKLSIQMNMLGADFSTTNSLTFNNHSLKVIV